MTIRFSGGSPFLLALSLAFWGTQSSVLSAEEKKPEEHREAIEAVRDVRPLPGALDAVPMFNSNSPEIVLHDGILLSTFPSCDGPANLSYSFDGRFDVFAHHIADGIKSGHMEELYLGLLVGNTSEKAVKVEVMKGASYVSQPDAPFVQMESLVDNPDGKIYAGPGDRVTDDILREEKPPADWKNKVTIRPGKKVLLKSFPLQVMFLTPHLNGRTILARMKSNGPVHLALISRFATKDPDGTFRSPSLEEFVEILDRGKLVEPRDVIPTRPEDKGALRYGRVSGVSSGSKWTARVTDRGSDYLALPPPEKPISYPISSVKLGTFGTGQVESAPMVVRYEDTAYQSHGNYGVKYDLTFPLKNTTDKDLRFELKLETPIKSDAQKDTVTFFSPCYPNVFFRGTIKIKSGRSSPRYIHVVEKRGESLAPLLSDVLPKGAKKNVHVELLYPPDATPPQLLTLCTSPDVECTESKASESK